MPKQRIILKGIPTSPGQVRGKVKIIKFQEEINELKPGEIMVATFINPDFIFFVKSNSQISGIITDRGGATCHAAIVARELKIPCITGTAKATKKLKDGMKIVLDGGKGIIYGEI